MSEAYMNRPLNFTLVSQRDKTLENGIISCLLLMNSIERICQMLNDHKSASF